MASVSLGFNDATDLIALGIEEQFRKAIFARLAEVAQEETEKLAREAAASVVAQVASYNRVQNDKIDLIVTFNTK